MHGVRIECRRRLVTLELEHLLAKFSQQSVVRLVLLRGTDDVGEFIVDTDTLVRIGIFLIQPN